jgi:transcriptional regulator with GAF, ATPase, and Fis domain
MTKKAKPNRQKVKTSVAEQAQTIAELRRQLAWSLEREKAALKDLQDRDQQLAESLQREKATGEELQNALEQQTATSEILGVIASSATDIQPVLEAIVKNAARVCGATDSGVALVDGDVYRVVATYGQITQNPVGTERAVDRDSVYGRTITDRQIVRLPDFLEVAADFPKSRALRRGYRTMLGVPLLREGVPIGAISFVRTEVRPFTDKQIALVKTFADQAVIAIENVRLFKELKARNAELREALEHQTATAEVLGIISRSPTDVQPVLGAIVESAARVCTIDDVVLRLREGNSMVARAHFGPIPLGRVEISSDDPRFRWVREQWHAPRSRRPCRAERFSNVGFLRGPAHLLGRSSLSARGTHWNAGRTSHRGAPIHAGADQTPRNVRRPGGDCHRERATVQ